MPSIKETIAAIEKRVDKHSNYLEANSPRSAWRIAHDDRAELLRICKAQQKELDYLRDLDDAARHAVNEYRHGRYNEVHKAIADLEAALREIEHE